MDPIQTSDPAEPALLVRRALEGDDQARERLAERASTLALRTASVLVGSREGALDIAQDAAYDALRSLGRLREPAAFDAWVHKITSRHAKRTLRKNALLRKRQAPLALALDRPDADRPYDELLAERSALASAVAALPARQRIAVALRYIHDLDDNEIAAAIGCRVGTVHSLLSRARCTLRRSEQLREPLSQNTQITEGVSR